RVDPGASAPQLWRRPRCAVAGPRDRVAPGDCTAAADAGRGHATAGGRGTGDGGGAPAAAGAQAALLHRPQLHVASAAFAGAVRAWLRRLAAAAHGRLE